MSLCEKPGQNCGDEARGLHDKTLYLNDELVRQQTAIIQDILTNGLKPSAELIAEQKLYLGSMDPGPNTQLYGHLLSRKSDIPRVLYGRANTSGDSSIFEVLMERPGELFPPPNVPTNILESRARASFLVVCDSSDRLSHRRAKVDSDEMIGVVFGNRILRILKLSNLFENVSVSTVDSMVKRVEGIADPLRLPNYGLALRNFLQRRTMIWVHGVRLPILEDLG